jgi:uncharacterized protein (DUF362 family)
MAKVVITRADGDLDTAVTKAIYDLGEQVIAPGDCVLIKPNLVHTMSYSDNDMTSPGVIKAVARYCIDQGAGRVIIGEGPGYYQPKSRLRECFTRTGVTKIAEELGIEWVLFDEHSYRTFKDISDCTPEEFRVTEYAFTCDKFINLPVLKTHYLTTVTLAMKNLKGCLKWEDKPRFHSPDLNRAIVELCKIVRPTFNIIDATTWKQGSEKLLIAGSDIVAVDAVGCALMGIDPVEVRTVTLGATAGLGECNLTQIDIIGEELKQLKLKIKLPQEQLSQSFPLLEIVGADKACSGCLIPLLSSLFLIGERGTKLEKPLRICLGKNPEVSEKKACLLVGDCAKLENERRGNWVAGCPPSREELLNSLTKATGK